jgi:hypothetical protein
LDGLKNNDTLEVVRQTTITLPFLDDEVPALYLEDGRLYIPVFAVCHVLGISPDIYIRRWQRLLLWVTACKLPFQTGKRGKHLVWCLLISEVPFLYGPFNWELVSPERQCQLRRSSMIIGDMMLSVFAAVRIPDNKETGMMRLLPLERNR